MSMGRTALAFPALGIMALAASWLAFQSFRTPPPVESEPGVQRPRYELEGAQWTRYDEQGAAVFRARTRSIDYFDDQSMSLTGVTLETLGEGQGHWQLNAARGTVPAGEQRVRLEPEVRVDGLVAEEPPLHLITPELWADWTRRRLDTEAAVHAEAPQRSLDAVGMQADWHAQRVRFLHDVRVRRDG